MLIDFQRTRDLATWQKMALQKMAVLVPALAGKKTLEQANE
jgi:hypothetical protein